MFILITALVVISGIVTIGLAIPIPNQDCLRPADSTARAQWLLAINADQESSFHESYYSIPAYR